MIEDEKGLVSPVLFKQLFFIYFKGEKHAYQVYEMLLPVVQEHYLPSTDCYIPETDPRASSENQVIVIQKLT